MPPVSTISAETPQRRLSPEYLDFIASDQWRDIRTEALRIYGRRCAGCMAGGALHLHHLFYPRILIATQVGHILPLCEACHKATHDQTFFHPTVFDETQCQQKRRQTIVYLQDRQRRSADWKKNRRAKAELLARFTPAMAARHKAKIERHINKVNQPWFPKKKKSHIFMSHAEYLKRMPAPG